MTARASDGHRDDNDSAPICSAEPGDGLRLTLQAGLISAWLAQKNSPWRMPAWASRVALVSVTGSVAVSLPVSRMATIAEKTAFLFPPIAAGILALIVPALKLVRTKARARALVVFNPSAGWLRHR